MKDYFQVFYKEEVSIIHKEYKIEFEIWLDSHRTSIGYLINHGLAKDILH